MPLIYVGDPTHRGWYDAFDWSGKPRGVIKLAAPLDDALHLIQAPDGSGFLGFLIGATEGTAQTVFYDRLGAAVTDRFTGRLVNEMWADDNVHLCTLEFQSQQWYVGVRRPGAAPAERNMVAIGKPFLQYGSGVGLSSCTASHDRAVLTYGDSTRMEFWVIRLSDGAILNHQMFPANPFTEIVSSPDGLLIAVNQTRSDASLSGPAAPSTIVRESDGSKVSDLQPGYRVRAFSRDDSVALVYTSPYQPGMPSALAVLNVRTGRCSGAPTVRVCWMRCWWSRQRCSRRRREEPSGQRLRALHA